MVDSRAVTFRICVKSFIAETVMSRNDREDHEQHAKRARMSSVEIKAPNADMRNQKKLNPAKDVANTESYKCEICKEAFNSPLALKSLVGLWLSFPGSNPK